MELLKFEVTKPNIEDLKNNPNLKFYDNFEILKNGEIGINKIAFFKGFYFFLKNSRETNQIEKIIVEGNLRTYWEYMNENSIAPNLIDSDLVLDHLFKNFNFMVDINNIKIILFVINGNEFIKYDDLPF